MDDIYEDLENYKDVNIVEELQSENKELKDKLNEYSAAIDKLQKDFDQLSSEYKRLECNYSSLLKTAQAEIERKTEIIKNLNLEKDLLVVNSLKNGKRKQVLNIKNLAAERVAQQRVQTDDKPKNKFQNTQKPSITNTNPPTKNPVVEERLKESKPSEESNKKMLPQTTRSTTFTETNGSRDGSESKENYKQSEDKEKNKQTTADIKSGGKSVAAERIEEDRDTPTERRKNPAERVPSDKYDKSYDVGYSRTSERTHSSEKYRDSSRDSRRSRDSKTYDYKYNDKYESQRRRYHSPETRHSRHSREYKEYRSDYRSRLETPPFDSEFYRHRLHDRIHPRDYDRPRAERHAVKHKIPISDEPYSKRSRNDLYQSYKRNEESEKRNEKDYLEHKAIAETFEQLQSQYTSCPVQSPDLEFYVYEGDSIKEIMNTAVVQLEDPRVSSSQYKLEKVDEKEVLSSSANINVELKIIDKSKWGIEKVNVPEELIQPIEEQQLVKEVSMNFDTPVYFSIRSETSEENIGNKLIINQSVESKTGSDTSDKTILQLDTNIQSNNNIDKEEASVKYTEPTIEKFTTDANSTAVIDNVHVTKDNSYEEKVKNNELTSIIDNTGTVRKLDSFKDLGFSSNFMNSSATFSQKTARDIVEGDLELSDETSDNIEYQKEIVHKKGKRKNGNIEITIEADTIDEKVIEESVDEKCTKPKIEQKIDHVNKKDKTEKQLKSTKKEKVKKKKSKVVKETSVNEDVNTENNKSINKDKPNEIKTKFRDLFGDSTSLITPEDLGILVGKPEESKQTNYVPIFEDATDGLELQEATKRTAENTKIDDPKITEPIVFNSLEIIKPKQNIENVLKTTKDASDSNEINLQPIQNEPDVVKTIVISTGIQPTVQTESPEIPMKPAEPINEKELGQKSLGIILNALATSTPYKLPFTVPDIVPADKENGISSSNCESNNTTKGAETSDNSSMIAQTDVPDVRIFVKRRRKTLKK